MAFYFRKLRRSLRLIPATTKSMGYSYSTRLMNEYNNEGDRCKEVDHLNSKGIECPSVLVASQAESLECLPILSSRASLIPLSLRDTALILSPQQERKCKNQLDNSEILSGIGKTILFASDDILVNNFCDNCYIHCPKNTTIERSVYIYDLDCQPSRRAKTLYSPLSTPHKRLSGLGTSTETATEPLSFSNDTSQQFLLFDRFLFSTSTGESGKNSSSKKGLPTLEQLHRVKEKLEENVHSLFKGEDIYNVLHENVVFENNLFGNNKISRGKTAYRFQLLILQLKIHSQLTYVAMEVLNTTIHEDSGVIRIHWRLKGVPRLKLLKGVHLKFLKSHDKNIKRNMKWSEAFSYYHIGKDGLVHKHRMDRMLPGNDEPVDKLSEKLREILTPKPLVN